MSGVPEFTQYVERSCEQLNKENSTLENMLSSTGIDQITGAFSGGLKNAVTGFVKQAFSKDSALMQMGEDVLSSMINENARKLSQNVMNEIEDELGSIAEARDRALVSMVSVLTFQNDMVLYFAATTAKECIKAIHDKDKVLQDILEKVRRLHNALLVLAGGGPFFNQYLLQLRQALILIHKSEEEIQLTKSAFFNSGLFPQAHFSNSKEYLAQAYDLIMPPTTGEEAEELKQGFLKGVISGPDYATQLSMLITIPKLTMELLKSYDYYVLKVLKVNALLLGFQTIVQNLEEVSNATFKEMVIKALEKAQTNVHDIVGNMAEQLNGDETIIDANKQITEFDAEGNAFLTTAAGNYEPNPTKTSAKTLKWAIDIKTSQVYLETISAQAMGKMDDSNAALRAYNTALARFTSLGPMRSATAIVEYNNGIETPGAFEADMMLFSVEANRALLDTSRIEGKDATMGTKTVLSIGAKLSSSIEMILTRNDEIESILLEYISSTEHLLDGVRATGDSMHKMLDKLGMDKAADSLKRGEINDFFNMSGKTASYVGAAMTGLTMAKSLLTSTAQRECVNRTINRLASAQTSSELLTKRTSKQNFIKQQTRNKKKCEQLKQEDERTKACTVGIDINSLISNPLPELSKIFGGLFGGSTFESLGTIPSPIAKIGSKAANSNALASIKSASDKVSSAKKDMADAVNKVEGYKASAEESLDSLKAKVDSAKKKVDDVKSQIDDVKAQVDDVKEGVTNVAAIGAAIASGDIVGALEKAGVKGQVAEYAKTKAKEATKYAKTAVTEFTSEEDVAEVAEKLDNVEAVPVPEAGITK